VEVLGIAESVPEHALDIDHYTWAVVILQQPQIGIRWLVSEDLVGDGQDKGIGA